MRTPRVSFYLAMLMLMSLLLAACGGGGGDTPDTPGGNTTQLPVGAGTAPATDGGAAAGVTATVGGTGAGATVGTDATAGMGATVGAGATVGTDATAGMGATAGTGATAGATTTGGGNAPVGAVAAPPACPATAQGQTVTMWSPLTGPDGDEMTRLAQQFTQENERGIKVQHIAQPEYAQKLTTGAASKRLPSMIVVRAGDVALFAEQNILKPMSDEALGAIAGDDVSGDFPEQVWQAGEYDGKRYSFPLDVHPLVMYYNKDLFKKAGLQEPSTDKPMTKAEFEAAVEKLRGAGVEIPWAIGTLFSSDTLFQVLLRQNGGSVVSEDGTQATYNSPEGVQALEYIRDQKQKNSPKIAGQGDPEVIQFQQGKAGIVFHGPWHISNLEKLPYTGFAPVPQFGNEYAVWGGSHQLGMTSDDPKQQVAAACWTGWLSSNSIEWAKAGQVPIRNSVRQSPKLDQEAKPIAAVAESVEDVALISGIPNLDPATMGEASKAIAAVVQGQTKDAKAALDQAKTRSDQILKQNAQRYGQ